MIAPVADRPVQRTVSGSEAESLVYCYQVNFFFFFFFFFWDPCIVDSRVLSCYDCLCLMALFRAVMSWSIIGPSGLYGLGPMLGIAGQWPGKNGIYHGYIHPVLWIGCVVIIRRSKYLELSLCLIGIGTLPPNGVLVRAGLRWGSSPREGFC